MAETHTMTDKMKLGAQTRLVALQTAQAVLQSYLDGCSDGLGLEGQWNLDASTWTFTKAETKEAEKCPST